MDAMRHERQKGGRRLPPCNDKCDAVSERDCDAKTTVEVPRMIASTAPLGVVGAAAAAYVATIIAGAILCGCAVNLFIDASGTAEATFCAHNNLTAVHWTCAVFLAAMMAYNLIRPVKMAHAKHAPCCSSHAHA